MKTIKYLTTLMAATFIYNSASAQLTAGININAYKALGQYANNIARNPSGISFFGNYQIPQSHFSIGGDFGAAMYANQEYTIKEAKEGGIQGPEITYYEEDCYLTYNVFGRAHLLKAEYGTVNPYIEAKIGASSYFSDKIAQEDPTTGMVPEGAEEDEFSFHGTAFNLGIGGGVYINVGELLGGGSRPFMLDIGVSTINGTRTHYRSIDTEAGVITAEKYNFYKSATDNIQLRFGFGVRF